MTIYYCIVCGKICPKRRRKDTCSVACGIIKAMALASYLHRYNEKLVRAAIKEWQEEH